MDYIHELNNVIVSMDLRWQHGSVNEFIALLFSFTIYIVFILYYNTTLYQ